MKLLAHGATEDHAMIDVAHLTEESAFPSCTFDDQGLGSMRLFLERSDLFDIALMVSVVVGVIGLLFLVIAVTKRVTLWKRIASLIVFLVPVALSTVLVVSAGERLFFGKFDSNHVHSDLYVEVNGEHIDLGRSMYLSSDEKLLSNFAHIHEPAGTPLHVHATGVTYGYALDTLGLFFGKREVRFEREGRIVPHNGLVRYWINGQLYDDISDVVVRDLDKLLIVVGERTREEIDFLQKKVPDMACVHSDKCPERADEKPDYGCSSE